MWDLAIAFFALTLVLTGWNSGFSNCWRSLITVPLATLFSSWVYANFCAWFEQNSWLPSDGSLFVGYIIVWIFFAAGLGTFISLLWPEVYRTKLPFWDKAAGGFVGAAKAALVLVLAALVSAHNDTFPEPPRMLWLPKVVVQAYRDSAAVAFLGQVAGRLPEAAVDHLVAKAGPQYQPVFKEDQPSAEEIRRTQEFRQLYKRMREMEMWDGE